MTPLMVACQSGEICSHAALILITHGARVNGLPNVRMCSANFECCAYNDDDE